ncbi:MAG TPA: DUF2934 domain-containing protein [Candidatus Acidoferrum sp.]|jgi:hypothetical protein|nr:DUF2934 domain-containing protein [Candidatus Acidoferrum sp.]
MPKKKTDAVLSAATTETKTRKPRAPKGAPTQEQIQLRAYEIFLERNGAPGDPLEDWVRAEQELRKNHKNGRSSKSEAA